MPFVYIEKVLSLSSAYEKWCQKQKCCVYNFVQYIQCVCVYVYIYISGGPLSALTCCVYLLTIYSNYPNVIKLFDIIYNQYNVINNYLLQQSCFYAQVHLNISHYGLFFLLSPCAGEAAE